MENVIIKSHINQLEVLKYCDVFVTHGGMNSVNEALYWGVPMCLHPFQVEQDIVVDRVVELQCGQRIKKLKPENVRQGVRKLLEDQHFRANCFLISQSFKEGRWLPPGGRTYSGIYKRPDFIKLTPPVIPQFR